MIRLILIFLLFNVKSACCQNIKDLGGDNMPGPLKNSWNAFNGTMDGRHFELSLYIFNNGTIQGYYYDSLCYYTLIVKGKINDNSMSLDAYKNDSAVGFFYGSIIKKRSDFDPNTIDKTWQGAWYHADKSKPFEARYVGAYGDGSFKGDFSSWGYYGDYARLQHFERLLKKALLSQDKKWLMDHTLYPLTVVINNQVATIRDKNEFAKKFDLIFVKEYLKKVENWCPYTYGVNGHGISIDNVWIGMCDHSTETNYDYCVYSF